MFVLLLGASIKRQGNRLLGGIVLVALVVNFPLLYWLSRQNLPMYVRAHNETIGIFVVDSYALFFKALFSLLGIILVFLSIFAILIRLLFSGLNVDLLNGKGASLLWCLGVFSLIGGSITLWVQSNIRRLFAAVSVIHAGYILIGLGVAAKLGANANEYLAQALFYLVAYAFAIIGIFSALSAYRSDGAHPEKTEDLRGLIRRSPALTIGITRLSQMRQRFGNFAR